MMERTPEQLKAINHRGSNILVSASAGSGKTSVMIERITNIIVNGEADISEILATTFTKLAAEEIKERLAKTLKEESKRNPQLKEQLLQLPYSNISTIHSFCATLLKTYFFEVGIDSNFRVMEEADSTQLKTEVINSLFDQLYEEKDKGFLALVDILAKKRTDNNLKELVLKVYNFCISESDPMGFMKKSQELYTKQGLEKIKEDYLTCLIEDLKLFIEPITNIKLAFENTSFEKYKNCIDGVLSDLEEIVKTKNLDNSTFILGRKESKPKEEEFADLDESFTKYKNKLKEIIIKGKDFLTLCQEEENFYKIGEDYALMVCLVEKFYYSYAQAKLDEGVLDFADLEQLTIKLLKKDAIAEDVKNRFKFIFIDEFQDVNSAQAFIINRIANNNLFMVGDVKQSIYGFRGCNSDIFLQVKKDYLAGNGEYIELKENFRSAKKVVDMVNSVFNTVMESTISGLDYEKAPMIYGGLYENFEGDTSLVFVAKPKEKKEIAKAEVYDLVEDAKQSTQESFEEGENVLALIDSLIGKSYYDCKTRTLKRIGLKDIVILFRSLGEKVEHIGRVISKKYKISIESKGKEPDYPEINLLVDCIRFLVKETDIPLATCLKSELGKLTDEDLVKIRKETPKGTFVQAVYSYQKDDEIKKKLDKFFEIYKSLRLKSEFENAGDIIGRILKETSMEVRFGIEPMGQEKLSRIYAFIKLAEPYTCEQLISRIDNGAIKLKKLATSGDDSIRFMTIHASKGLEFPVVILAETHKQFNMEDLKDVMLFERNYGISFRLFDRENKIYYKTNPLRALLSYKLKRNAIKEEMRLLYVAMTRAKYRLYVLENEREEREKIDRCDIISINSLGGFIKDTDAPINFISGGGEKLISEEKEVVCVNADEQLVREIKNNLSAKYVDESYPLKSSVTGLSSDDVEVEHDYTFGQTSAEIGTAYHKFLEKWDFSTPWQELFSNLEENGFTQEEIALLDKSVLEKICQMPVFEKVKGYKLHKEQPFVCGIPKEFTCGEFDFSKKDNDVVLQGIIDLLAISGDKAIIIDYKFSSIATDKDLFDKYSPQLNLYKYAVEKLLNKKAECFLVNIYNQKVIKL